MTRRRGFGLQALFGFACAAVACVPETVAVAPPPAGAVASGQPARAPTATPPTSMHFCSDVGSIGYIIIEIRSIELPERVSGTACWKADCLPVAFDQTVFATYPFEARIPPKGDDDSFSLVVRRGSPGTIAQFSLRSSQGAKDGDVYTLKLDGPDGSTFLDVSTPVTYDPPTADPCRMRVFSARVVID